ncbi:hypothetical protein KHA97_10000 [Bacillus sp. FJAT-49870]|uniref:Uncharacterized protein n=1 Tax=Lederbergia citri TaxID=2833580 RepID=A0A942TF57_9BACI|nr:hypothetical protein [Lederbergia citri]
MDDWNTTTFHAYLSDKHAEMFGCDYVPFRGWTAEKGMIGNLIGTRTKPRTASNEDVKRFIDETFAEYRPSAQYPGTSFGFMFTYRKNVWQRIQLDAKLEAKRKEQAQAKAEKQAVDFEKLADWL